jgi:hypothetical protein
LTMVLAGFFGVLWVYYEFRHTPLGWNSRSRSSRSLQLRTRWWPHSDNPKISLNAIQWGQG